MAFRKLFKSLSWVVGLVALTVGTVGIQPTQVALADMPGGTPTLSVSACSTTDYDAVAAKALGMTAAELRLALVSGQSVQDIADSKNVSINTVRSALIAAWQADYMQAVKDGSLESPNNRPGAPSNPNEPGPQAIPPQSIPVSGPSFGLDMHNVVRPMIVAAQALNMKCADLLAAVLSGKSIVLVAFDKNIKAQVVVDALMKMYTDARAEDVKEGLISQAEADGQNNRLIERVFQMMSSSSYAAILMLGLTPMQYNQHTQNLSGSNYSLNSANGNTNSNSNAYSYNLNGISGSCTCGGATATISGNNNGSSASCICSMSGGATPSGTANSTTRSTATALPSASPTAAPTGAATLSQ